MCIIHQLAHLPASPCNHVIASRASSAAMTGMCFRAGLAQLMPWMLLMSLLKQVSDERNPIGPATMRIPSPRWDSCPAACLLSSEAL